MMFPAGLGTGGSLHAIWRDEFRHRWGGNAPSWEHLSEQERRLWLHVEHRTLLDLLMPYVLARFTVLDAAVGGQTENAGDWRGQLERQMKDRPHAPDCRCNYCIGAVGSPFPSEPIKYAEA